MNPFSFSKRLAPPPGPCFRVYNFPARIPDMAKWFHTRFREARERAGLSQAELADHLGVAGATISSWENRTREPRAEQRDKAMAWVERIENGSRRRRSQPADSDLAKGRLEPRPLDESDVALRSLQQIYEYWPQSRIAEALSISQATVSNWLRTGNVTAAYSDTLQRLQAELNQETHGKAQKPKGGELHTEETPYADWLRSELERQKLNAVQLAQQSGVHINTILALLEGRTERPQQRTRQRIEKTLHATGAPHTEPAAEHDPWYYIGLEWTNDEIEQVPDEPGVYMIHDRLGRPAYVGVAHKGAGGIRARLRKHNELRWTSDRRVAYSFSYVLSARMPHSDPSELAKALEKLLIKFMGNAILINEKDVENIAG